MLKELTPPDPILVIDDEQSILLSVDTILQMSGFNHILTCADSRQAMAIIEQRTPSVILLDLNMPHINGETLIEKITPLYPNLPIIIITGKIDAETAVDCMKSGAFDYIVKPVDEERLLAAVAGALPPAADTGTMEERQDDEQRRRLHNPEAFSEVITRSSKMCTIFEYIESIAPTDLPVLIKGETGTGKELIARAIHRLSGRIGGFVAVNVAGLDDNVFSDTLFGHVKGAFTGAEYHRSGLIEQAADGTLFLDEIGDLSAPSQIKLLRLLQEKEYMPLGQDGVELSSARILASTHVDLWAQQQKGMFRQDLNYRLDTHHIPMPPLRDRREDLRPLTEHFLARAAEALGKGAPQYPTELIPLLETYHFPGNIRELQAMVFDALAQHKTGMLSLAVFREHMARSRKGEARVQNDGFGLPFAFADPLPTIKQAVQQLIEEAMTRSGNNQSIAAVMLGISQQALSKRLKNMAQERHD